MMESGCCCGKFAIVIYNSNSAKDDNFKIVLNGTDIGHIDNNQNALTGRIFAEEEPDFPSTDITTPNPNAFEATLALDMNLLVEGTNTLRVESIQDNTNGNLGSVRVGYWLKDGTTNLYELTLPGMLNTLYGFLSGVGNGNDFTFTYP